MKPKIDLAGKRYGRLLVTESSYPTAHGYAWDCICECGATKRILAKALKSGATKSCGCIRREYRCGVSGHRLASTHSNMMARCYNPGNKSYFNYGAKGITVCERWHSLRNFVEDMESVLTEGLTLDRIDSSKPYSPENCKASTHKEQQRNRGCTVKITFGGVTKPLTEWAEELGIKPMTLRYRLKAGWKEDRIFTPNRS